MRITLVLEDLNDTGANRVSLDRAARWLAGGDEVTVFVTSTAVTRPVPLPAPLVPVIAAPGRDRLRSTLPVALLNLVQVARRSDLVIAGTEVGFGLLLARLATRLTRRPFAVFVQSRVDLAVENYVEPRLRRLTRRALTSADLAVCVAQGLVESTVEYGLSADRVIAVPNAVPRRALVAASAAPPEVRSDWPEPLVVGVGRLTHQKGFDLLIRAHAAVLEAGGPAHRLMVLGDGDDREALVSLAAELGVQDSVTLPGAVANPHAVVARSAVYVLSSRWEGFGLTLAEALACGTACIAFDCIAGPAEILGGGRYGRLVPPGDVAALAAAIREHLADPRDLAARARSAADDDLGVFEPARAAELHRSALSGLVARRGRAGT